MSSYLEQIMSDSCGNEVVAPNSTTEFGLRKTQYLFVHHLVCLRRWAKMVVTYFKSFTSIHVEGFRNVKHVPSEFGSQHLPHRHQTRSCSSQHALSARWEDMAMNHWVLLPVSVFCGPGIATFLNHHLSIPGFRYISYLTLCSWLPVTFLADSISLKFHRKGSVCRL
jgi:hypothetical protein